MPLILRLAVATTLLLVSACGGDGAELGSVTWDPPLDDGETSTTIELGAIQQGESATATVIATNNSSEDVTFQLNCSFQNGGFLIPGCPEELMVPAGESGMPIRANLSTNLSGQYSGSFQFVYNDDIATFIIQGTVQ
jgi:hypothetical protein